MIPYNNQFLNKYSKAIFFSTPLLIVSNMGFANSEGDNIPALLQFAELYAEKKNNSERKTAPKTKISDTQKEVVRKRTLVQSQEKCVLKSDSSTILADKDREIANLTLRLNQKINQQTNSKDISTELPFQNTQSKLKSIGSTLTNAKDYVIPNMLNFVNIFTHKYNPNYNSLTMELNKQKNLTKTLVSENSQLKLDLNNLQIINNSLMEKSKDTSLNKEINYLKTKLDSLLKVINEKDDIIQAQYDNINKLELQTNTLTENNKLVDSLELKLKETKIEYENTITLLESKNGEVNDLNHKLSQAAAENSLSENLINNLKSDISSLKSNLITQTKLPEKLKSLMTYTIDDKSTQDQKLSYSLGTFIGEDVLKLNQEYDSSGLITDKIALLSGIIDAFGNNFRMSLNDRKTLADEFDKQFDAAIQQTNNDTIKENESFINDIIGKEKMTKSDYGFWYKTLKTGKGKSITLDTEVEISVKETLSDGTIIQDMIKSNKTLIKTADQLPPLFRNAVLLMKKGGKLKIVVPPELAYGKKGLEPKIPPDSVMLYEIIVH